MSGLRSAMFFIKDNREGIPKIIIHNFLRLCYNFYKTGQGADLLCRYRGEIWPREDDNA